ncbi:MAG: SMI1/KNR4 family protein [Alphaproteobacteria bacterium]
MSMSDLKEAFELIAKNFPEEETGFLGPKPDTFIDAAEELLELKFPKTYREFMKTVGHGGPGDAFIPGIHAKSLDQLELGGVVWGVLNDRDVFDFPDHLIKVYHADDTSYCLDTAQMDSEECPVILWPVGGYHETPVLEIAAKDFGEFFLKKVREEIISSDKMEAE